jgi:SAM-dependent methyltransferase
MRCPVCQGPSRHRLTKDGYRIRRCSDCGHGFVENALPADHVERVYGDDYFVGGGAGYADYLSEARILREQGRWYARLLGPHREPGTVLDVGCAAGFRLQGLLDAGWRGRGLEPNPGMAEHARRLGLDVVTGTLEEHRSERRFDLVCLIQVAAHFVEPRRAFARAAELTEPGGMWLVETWDAASWTARCFGRHWHEYSPPSVLHWFTVSSLERLAAGSGMRPLGRGRPSKWIGAGHAKSLLRHKLAGSAAGRLAGRLLSVVPDRLSIPYPADDLFWELFEKAPSVPSLAPRTGIP